MDESIDETSLHAVEPPRRRGSTARQYEILISFMEKHGDLSRPMQKGQSMQSRILNMQLWQELEKKLNSEPGRFSKTLLKWKKVWADLKTLTKRKAAMIRLTAGKCNTKLSPYELRVLKVMGMAKPFSEQSQNGAVIRLPSKKLRNSQPKILTTLKDQGVSQEEVEELDTSLDWSQNQNTFTEQQQIEVEYLDTGFEEVEVLEELDADEEALPQVDMENDDVTTLSLPKPDSEGYTTTRGVAACRMPRSRRSLDRAARHFLKSDAKWKHFQMETRRRELSLERTRLALRAKELRMQKGWQDICTRGLTLLQQCIEKTLSPQIPDRRADDVQVEVETLSDPELIDADDDYR